MIKDTPISWKATANTYVFCLFLPSFFSFSFSSIRILLRQLVEQLKEYTLITKVIEGEGYTTRKCMIKAKKLDRYSSLQAHLLG